MTGGGSGSPPPADGGEFLLHLLKNPPRVLQHPHNPEPQSPVQPPPPTTNQILTHDPAVAALGPSVSIPFPQNLLPPSGLVPPPQPWPHHHRHQSPPPPYAPHSYFLQNPNPSSSQVFPPETPLGFSQDNFLQNSAQLNYNSSGDGVRKLGFLGTNSNTSSADQQDAKDIVFGSLRVTGQGFLNGNFGENLLASQEDERNFGISRIKEKKRDTGLEDTRRVNEPGVDFQQISVNQNSRANSSVLRGHGQEISDSSGRGTRYWGKQGHNFNSHRSMAPPPRFTSQQMSGGSRESTIWKENFDHYRESRYPSGKDEMDGRFYSRDDHRRFSRQLDRLGPPAGSKLLSVPASDIEESMTDLAEDGKIYKEFGNRMRDTKGDILRSHDDLDGLEEQLVDSLGLEDESGEKSDQKKHHGTRDREYRSDKRGQFLMSQRRRQLFRKIACRVDIDMWNASFLAIYESLIPAEEEKVKQKQLLMLLEKIVCKEWPEARLFVYGSCANSFGFSKSDIDVCLTIDVEDIKKSDVLLKLAEMLQLENLKNVQALTHARVPIVKLMDPETGISCDICINNVLAVVNTKLLRDYAQIDLRLRQVAFLVKHWAKSRGVNETYQGTLSSYAYVLMCIHFLQHRRPAILPCLQEMNATYSVTVDNVEYSYFDQVENLVGYGSQNKETIAQLVWGFFNYWAYCHDYAHDVISVRTGTILSKSSKDWTRRIGKDRHLICIEDPLEISHDLGRVVDKFSIRVLREEFERAAEIMQYDPNPCVKLFEPYINIPT